MTQALPFTPSALLSHNHLSPVLAQLVSITTTFSFNLFCYSVKFTSFIRFFLFRPTCEEVTLFIYYFFLLFGFLTLIMMFIVLFTKLISNILFILLMIEVNNNFIMAATYFLLTCPFCYRNDETSWMRI